MVSAPNRFYLRLCEQNCSLLKLKSFNSVSFHLLKNRIKPQINPIPYAKCNIQKAKDINGINLNEGVEKILADQLKIKYRNPTEKVIHGNCRTEPIIKVIIRETINIDGIM